MDQVLKFRKVASLPVTYEGSTMYMVADTVNAALFEMYLSSADGTTVRHLLNKSEIQTMINTSVAGSIAGMGTMSVVNDIAARNALNPATVSLALVLNATADTTVATGAATYVYNTATSAWVKIAEYESLDVVLQWSNIVGRPTSTPAQIDAAVTGNHNHGNKPVLDGLSIASGGSARLLSAGQPIRGFLEEESW
jgi:hypothetical protein